MWTDWEGGLGHQESDGLSLTKRCKVYLAFNMVFGFSGLERKGIERTGMHWIARRRRIGWSTAAL